MAAQSPGFRKHKMANIPSVLQTLGDTLMTLSKSDHWLHMHNVLEYFRFKIQSHRKVTLTQTCVQEMSPFKLVLLQMCFQ